MRTWEDDHNNTWLLKYTMTKITNGNKNFSFN